MKNIWRILLFSSLLLTACGTGPKGNDGITPTIGSNGNWFIGTVDTGVKAKGENGRSPVVTIGANYNWFIDGEDTGVSAKGLQGDPGKDGATVTGINRVDTKGNMDLYRIYFSDGTSVGFTVTNGINGEQGIQGEKGEDGHTPVITIGENGHWFVDGVDTNISAQGAKGNKGDKGEKGDKGDKGDKGEKGADATTYIPCTFLDYNGNKIYEKYYEKGSDIVYDGPSLNLINQGTAKFGYEFVGWDKSLENIQTPTIFKAQGTLKTIHFGNYPQTVVEDDALITILDGIMADFDGYKTYNNEKYLSFYGAKYTASSGSEISAGEHYYKVEPIKWNAIYTSSDYYTLLTDKVIDTQMFDLESNNYENSFIRNWLNYQFSCTAFNPAEYNQILTTLVNNNAATTDCDPNPNACNNTQDKTFLLSYQDYLNPNYGFSSDPNADDVAKYCQPTDYALSENCRTSRAPTHSRNCFYWTRSPIPTNTHFPWYVSTSGRILSSMYRDGVGVRPALNLKIS